MNDVDYIMELLAAVNSGAPFPLSAQLTKTEVAEAVAIVQDLLAQVYDVLVEHNLDAGALAIIDDFFFCGRR